MYPTTNEHSATFLDLPPATSASALMRRYLQMRPSGSPTHVAEWLARFNVRLEPDVIHALLAAMKTG